MGARANLQQPLDRLYIYGGETEHAAALKQIVYIYIYVEIYGRANEPATALKYKVDIYVYIYVYISTDLWAFERTCNSP